MSPAHVNFDINYLHTDVIPVSALVAVAGKVYATSGASIPENTMILRCPHCPACARGAMHDLWIEAATVVQLWDRWQNIAPMPPDMRRMVAGYMGRLKTATEAVPRLELEDTQDPLKRFTKRS